MPSSRTLGVVRTATSTVGAQLLNSRARHKPQLQPTPSLHANFLVKHSVYQFYSLVMFNQAAWEKFGVLRYNLKIPDAELRRRGCVL